MSQNEAEADELPTFGVRAEAETATRTTVETRGFEFVVDEPEDLGGDDEGPNPVEYLAGSWAGCLNVVGHLVADEMDIELDGLAIDVEGELDPARLFGHDEDVRAGYQEVRMSLSVDTGADEETLQEWFDEVEERCPVTDNLANPTPIDVTIAET